MVTFWLFLGAFALAAVCLVAGDFSKARSWAREYWWFVLFFNGFFAFWSGALLFG